MIHRSDMTPPELATERVEAQLRRARRWNMPRTPRPAAARSRFPEYRISPRKSPPKSLRGLAPRHSLVAAACGIAFNMLCLAVMAAVAAPAASHAPEPTLQLVMPRSGGPGDLDLAVDIRTTLGKQPAWDHLDQAVGRPMTSDSPLAIPSVLDDFVGNPLSVTPTAGGSVIVGGQRGHASRGDGYDGAAIMGVKARGERFVFVLDNTLPMAGEPWRRVRREALAGVSRLQPGQRFAVMLCGGDVYPQPGTLPPPQLSDLDLETPAARGQLHWHRAEPGATALLAHWLDTRVLVQQPQAAASLHAALHYQPDAVYLIGGVAYPSSLADPIRRRNRWVEEDRLKVPGSVIHAVGVGASELETRGLRQIAEQNAGHFFQLSVE